MSRQEQVGVAGLDVSAKELVVAREGKHGPAIRRFGNASSGHQALIRWLREHGIGRVVLEASGIYSLDVALAIHAEADLEVMVANPRAVHAFAMALKTRHKTDPVDAAVMLVFGQRMPFEPWQPPPQGLLELRTVMRRMRSLTRALTREKNQQSVSRGEQDSNDSAGGPGRHGRRHSSSRATCGSARRRSSCARAQRRQPSAPTRALVLGAWHRGTKRLPDHCRARRLAERHDREAVGRTCGPRPSEGTIGHLHRQAEPHLSSRQPIHASRPLHADAVGRAS
jgi:hypothetical protein